MSYSIRALVIRQWLKLKRPERSKVLNIVIEQVSVDIVQAIMVILLYYMIALKMYLKIM